MIKAAGPVHDKIYLVIHYCGRVPTAPVLRRSQSSGALEKFRQTPPRPRPIFSFSRGFQLGQLRQLPGIGDSMCVRLAAGSVVTLVDLARSSPAKVDTIAGRKHPFGHGECPTARLTLFHAQPFWDRVRLGVDYCHYGYRMSDSSNIAPRCTHAKRDTFVTTFYAATVCTATTSGHRSVTVRREIQCRQIAPKTDSTSNMINRKLPEDG